MTAAGGATLQAAYEAENQALRIRLSRVGTVLAIVLVPLFWGLDLIVYPDQARDLLAIRALCSAGEAVILALLWSNFAARIITLLGVAWAFLPGVAIAWMIHATEGARSPYYAGLNLVIITICLLMPWTLVEVVILSALMLLAYTASCVLHTDPMGFPASLFANNAYFIAATAIICSTSAWFGARRRFTEFSLRHEIGVRNRELETLLAQVRAAQAELADRNRELERTLTQLRATEAQLLQSEKMNALGSMAGGILHEINNPINYTKTALHVALDNLPADADLLREVLSDIRQGIERIESIITGLRSFAHPESDHQQSAFTVTEAVALAVRFTAQQAEAITIDVDCGDAPAVRGSCNQLSQVLVNLVANACHALRDAGRTEPRITISARAGSGGMVEIRVTDNGTGIPEAIQKRIFDPFFTTKPVGQGTGLGLAICHTIMTRHGGSISVASEPGVGATFVLTIPAADAACPSPEQGPQP